MKKKHSKNAFSFLELSMCILIIGILIAGVVSGIKMQSQSNLKSAQSLTMNSPIWSMPDLVLWLEPTLSGSFNDNISDGDPIYSWNDISNSKINLKSDTGNQPKYLLSGINNLPSVSFDASSHILFSDATKTKAPISEGNGQYTMIVVFRPNISSGNFILLEQKPNSNSDNLHCAISVSGGYIKMSGYNNDSSFITSIALNDQRDYAFTMVVDNTQSSNNVLGYLNSNNEMMDSNSDIGSLNISGDVFSVGGRLLYLSRANQYQCSNCFNGLISEVIVFNRNLNPTEVASINNYLSKKYKITLS